jgi:hypothetical protein
MSVVTWTEHPCHLDALRAASWPSGAGDAGLLGGPALGVTRHPAPARECGQAPAGG